MSKALPLLCLLVVAASGAGIEFERTFRSLDTNYFSIEQFELRGPNNKAICDKHDAYGDTDCKMVWGEAVSVAINVTLHKAIPTNTMLSVKASVGAFGASIPFDFSCPLCGANCVFTVPVVGTKITRKMPPCPTGSEATHFTKTFRFNVPSKNPLPFPKFKMDGSVMMQVGRSTPRHQVLCSGRGNIMEQKNCCNCY